MNLSVQEAARILGKSERQVRYLIKTGRLQASKTDTEWRIDRDDLPLSPGQARAQSQKTERATEVAAAVLELGDGSAEHKSKAWTLDKLHAVREGEPLYRELIEKAGAEHPAARFLYEALMLVACGFFEFDAERKAARYSAARDQASQAVMALLLDPERQPALLERLQKELLPAIGGLVRRAQRSRRKS